MRIEPYELIESKYRSYDKNTRTLFLRLKKLINSAIPETNIEHTGSTAIGISGKNLIDTLLICKNNNYRPATTALKKLGFHTSPFKNIPKYRPLLVGSIPYGGKKYQIHVHITSNNSEDHKNIIFFRDYLKTHPTLAKQYDSLKKSVIDEGLVDATEYNEQKAAFITSILKKRKKPTRNTSHPFYSSSAPRPK